INGISLPPKVVEICKQHGIDISSHSSLPLAEDLVIDSDIILAMEKEQIQSIAERFPEAKEKVKMLSSYSEEYQGQDIKDPIGGSLFGFRTTLAILDECVKGLLSSIQR
ncbi:MAG: hypothetical protein V3U15_02235, partial [Nitrospinota bacterium]